MTSTLGTSEVFDNAAFALPPTVARMDAVRKLAARLTEVTELGETAAATLAEAATDPAAVRTALADPLPGLTAHREAHLWVIPMRVWTPWVTAPANEIPRYRSKKRLPANPSNTDVPPLPRSVETADGLLTVWPSAADRAWHLADNEDLYAKDVHAARLRIFPDKGGVATPLVLIPQTETFADGQDCEHSLRIADGRRRFFVVRDVLEDYADLDAAMLAGHLGTDITPDIFKAALARDRSALLKVVNAVRGACAAAGDGNDFQQHVGVHYLATALSVPAYVVVGTADAVTSERFPLGAHRGYPLGASYALSDGMVRWHSGEGYEAKLVSTGQRAVNGLRLPEASIDSELLAVADKRLLARQVPRDVVDFGRGREGRTRAAAQFVWWCRAIAQLGGTSATAVAAFASHTEGRWPEQISGPLLACASHLMGEDRGPLFPPGDYRNAEARPDSLSLLSADADNLAAVAGLTPDGHGGVLAHPRLRNAQHIALAHLALIGALPPHEPLPTRLTEHHHLLSHIALAWSSGQTALFVKAQGGTMPDVPIDERTLTRDDLPWPKAASSVSWLLPPSVKRPYDATHLFQLRYGVDYTVPSMALDEARIEATPESIASVVRRWFPDATGIVLTDWQDKFVTGVMVGSVFVRLYDRQAEREEARGRGVWYPEGRPAGTKDVIEFDSPNSGVPVGYLLGTADWLGAGGRALDVDEANDALFTELDDAIIGEIDDALGAQEAIDARGGSGPDRRLPRAREIPVLRLPSFKGRRPR
ncbi:hypothetical protein ACFYN0_26895 [Streptomyces sp. NPDC006704]|uniref:hypothetical protein n=1 Tax=Streptomyces sp. NPDC006704 TaxID=3364760 RepID=UPI0036977473